MTLHDLAKGKDPLFDLLDSMGEDEGKKKKKKKDRDKSRSKAVKKHWLNSQSAPSMEDLRSMSKSDLRDYMVKKGVHATSMDLTSKKAMRKAILAHFGVVASDDNTTVALSQIEATPVPSSERVLKNRPPYYYDENNGDFVVVDAQNTDPLTCYDAMSALGEVRRRKNAEDGFAVMIDRLTSRIMEEAKKPGLHGETVIDAEFEVIDEPKGLPAPQAKALPAPKKGK